MKQHYQNFVFDLYGTLVDIHTNENRSDLWEKAALFFQQRDIPFTPEQLRAKYFHYCDKLLTNREMTLHSQAIPGPAEIDITEVWQALTKEKGKAFSPAECLEFSHLFRAWSTERIRLYPEALNLLRALRKRNKTIILLTNAQASFTRPELEQLGLEDCFDKIIMSSDYGFRKPSPAFFGLLQESGIKPDDCLMVGNDDVCDCHGAAARGIDSLYIHTEQSPDPNLPLPENCTEIHSIIKTLAFA